MAKPFQAAAEVDRIHDETGLPVLIGAAIDDGEGGVFIQVAYGGLSVEDAEYVAGTILRDLRANMETDFHECEACRRRRSRIIDALAALERDGAKPTGLQRGETH